MKQLEERIEKECKPWYSYVCGIVGAAVGTFGVNYALDALGVMDRCSFYHHFLMPVTGFVGAYYGLDCNKLVDYFQKRKKSTE